MKTNFKVTLAAIIGLVTGGAAGFFFQTADTTEDSAKGDIAKVSKFSKSVVSPIMSAFQEKITSNPDELKKATASLTILTSRMTEFDELVNIAVIASEGKEELESSVKNLQNLKQLASNARENGLQALESLNAITEGKKSSVNYEQASQNLALAYMMVDRQINVGKQYVCDVDTFLRGKEIEDYKDLALARDLWAGYCTGNAVLNSDKEELAYWQKQQNLLPEETAALSLQNAGITLVDSYDFTVLQQSVTVDNIIGLIDSSSAAVIENSESAHIMEGNPAQAFILGNKEVIESVAGEAILIKDVETFREMLNLSSGTMLEMDPAQLMRNSVPAMEVWTLNATDGPMAQTREHILL